jgi:hypothetical protein
MGGRFRRPQRTAIVRRGCYRRIAGGGLLGGERAAGGLPALEVLDGLDGGTVDSGEVGDSGRHSEKLVIPAGGDR